MMSKLTKYLIFFLLLLLVTMSSYIFYLKNQTNTAKYKLEKIHSQLTQAIKTNEAQQQTIDLLNQQSQLTDQYINDLERKKEQSQKNIEELQQAFKRKQHDNKIIRNWSNEPLPNGLY